MNNYNTEKEIWKDIEGYEGLYQVSNLGRIKSLEREVVTIAGVRKPVPEKIKKIQIRKDGYKSVQLYKDNKQKGMYIHRLVAKAFIANPKGFEIINHIDENPSNNYYKNLEWCNHQYNLTYGNKIQKTLDSEGYKERTEKIKRPIYVKTPYDELMWFESITLACEVLGLEHPSVVACLRGRNETHRNLRFEYAEPID